jgi:hypothetical protein
MSINTQLGVGQQNAAPTTHPLYPIFVAAIEQAMHGKGVRHGGNVTPFLDQPWAHYAKLHGRGFLTGQAAKKLEEAASGRMGQAFESEMLGAIVYCGMAILKERQEQEREKAMAISAMSAQQMMGAALNSTRSREELGFQSFAQNLGRRSSDRGE